MKVRDFIKWLQLQDQDATVQVLEHMVRENSYTSDEHAVFWEEFNPNLERKPGLTMYFETYEHDGEKYLGLGNSPDA